MSRPRSTCLPLLGNTGLDLLSLCSRWELQTSLLNDCWAGKKTLLRLLSFCADLNTTLPLSSPPALLKQPLSGLSENPHLSVLDSVQPVAERCANAGVDRVRPKDFLVEEWAHLNTELP